MWRSTDAVIESTLTERVNISGLFRRMDRLLGIFDSFRSQLPNERRLATHVAVFAESVDRWTVPALH